MKCEEIFVALAMLEKERGIPQTFMMGKIIQALTTAYKRDHEGVENVIVDVDEEKQELKMYVQKEIVEVVENPGTEISLEEAKRLSAKHELGGIVNLPVENVEFGRIAAGNGKQVIIQGLREAEHGMIYDEFNSKQHEILTGTVMRIDPRTGNVGLKIGTGSDESYTLDLTREGIVITADSTVGAFYAVQTLRQILQNETVYACHIEDAPDFSFRGFYHDVTRGRIPTMETLKKLVDYMASMKLNSLQLYVEHSFAFREFADSIEETGCITPEEIRELDDYCYENFIELIPSMSCFGHLYVLLEKPQYKHLQVAKGL